MGEEGKEEMGKWEQRGGERREVEMRRGEEGRRGNDRGETKTNRQ